MERPKAGRRKRAQGEPPTSEEDAAIPNHRCSCCGGSLRGGAWKRARPDGGVDRLCYPCAWNPVLAPGPRIPVKRQPRRSPATEEEEGWE